MKFTCRCVVGIATLLPTVLLAAEPGRRYDLVARASEIDPAASEHPEIGFTFTDRRPASRLTLSMQWLIPACRARGGW